MLNIVKLIIKSIFNDLMYFISYLIPKNKNLWIFGAWMGQNYSDNCKYLFEYVNKNQPEIKAIWLTNNNDVVKMIKTKGYEAYNMKSLKGHYLSLKAGVCIISHTKLGDLNDYVGPKANIVQLWHGIPLKKIQFDNPKNECRLNLKWRFIETILPFIVSNYSLIVATSNETKNKFASAFNTSHDKIKITGYPRNDILFKKTKHIDYLIKGVYLPTLRGKASSEFNLFSAASFEIQLIENFLKCYNTHLYIKLHPLNSFPSDIYEKIKLSKFIHIFDEDIYENLYQFDFLITDYSSIFFDYLLLDKPIIFAPFDYKEYINDDRGLYYNYNKYTPGPKAKNWEEIIIHIKEAIENPDKYKDDRKNVRDIFHEYLDDKSSNRVYNAIIKNLYE